MSAAKDGSTRRAVAERTRRGSCNVIAVVARLPLMLFLALVLVGCGHRDRQALHLQRLPYVGLACKESQPHPCDRVGLAVWVPRRAASVSADLHGQKLALVTRPGGSGEYAAGRFWRVFFSDPYVATLADASRRVRVRIAAVFASRESRATSVSVLVSQGYG